MRDIETDLLDYCAANDIGVIPYSPMQSGLPTWKFTREHITSLPETDWRRRTRPFKEPNLTANLALVDKLRPIAARYDRPLGQLAIAWALRRPSQIEESAPASDWNRGDAMRKCTLCGEWLALVPSRCGPNAVLDRM